MTTINEPDVRYRQAAATSLHRLLADIDYLASPDQAAAATMLAQAARRAHPLLVTGQLADWKQSWDTGERQPLTVKTEHAAEAAALARAVLTVHQQLTGPAARINDDLTLQAGDQIRIDPAGADHLYTRSGHRLESGALATVTSVADDHQTLTMEVATAGCTIEVAVDDPAAHTIRHAYTEPPEPQSHEHDNHTVGVGTARDRSLGLGR